MLTDDQVEDVRLAVYDGFRRTGRAPGNPDLARRVGIDAPDVSEALT
jgi:hypothetical protein